MKENLTARVGRIVSGSLAALVDAVENAAPEIVMQEAIREIDGAIDDVRVELGKTVAQRHLANNRLAEENEKHASLLEQVSLAVEQGRDDLAEAGIAKQLDIEAQIPVLEKAIVEAMDSEKELDGYIQALQAKRREMKDELARFLEARKQADAAASGAVDGAAVGSGADSVSQRVAKAESAFDRVLEKQTGFASGNATGDAQSAAKLAELEELSRNNRIAERLAALKAKKPA